MLHYDNEDYVYELRKFIIRESTMTSLRKIAILVASYNILLISIWIPTKTNQLANNLSRFRYRKIANKFL